MLFVLIVWWTVFIKRCLLNGVYGQMLWAGWHNAIGIEPHCVSDRFLMGCKSSLRQTINITDARTKGTFFKHKPVIFESSFKDQVKSMKKKFPRLDEPEDDTANEINEINN